MLAHLGSQARVDKEADMEKQRVNDWMTSNPVTITKNTSLTAASRLMKGKDIRHLPVVESSKVVGMVTWGDIREISASDVAELAFYELPYLYENVQVSSIMTRHPITIAPTTTITCAARIMLDNKFGGLPVIEHGKLVGILTENDIFRMLVTGNAA
jgi:acetoin utilization protein AcuB